MSPRSFRAGFDEQTVLDERNGPYLYTCPTSVLPLAGRRYGVPLAGGVAAKRRLK